MNRLYGPRFQPKIREYLTKLREQAFLEIKPGFVDSGAAAGQGHVVERPGATEAGNGDEGRSRQYQAPEADAVGDPDAGHQRERSGAGSRVEFEDGQKVKHKGKSERPDRWTPQCVHEVSLRR